MFAYRLQAIAEATPGSVPYRIFGNTTTAQNGTARFTGLTVNGLPGDTVTLVFRTQNGLSVTRQVILRQCQAGEYTDNSTSAPNELSFSCRPCQSPQYSFYPSATSCSQCALLPVNSWSVCNEAALVPADGYYQSHPRSPVVSCLGGGCLLGGGVRWRPVGGLRDLRVRDALTDSADPIRL